MGKKRSSHLIGAVGAGLAIALCHSQAAQAIMIRLPVDTQASHISATVNLPLARMRDQPQTTGTFEIITGEIDGDPDNLAATGHVSLVVDATTYHSGNGTRDTHVIHSALETFNYSAITFESTRIENIQVEVPDALGTATVVGNLRLHGVTRQISVPVNLSMTPDGVFNARGEVTFDYADFGITPPTLFFIPAGKEVTVSFDIQAERPSNPATPSP
ncbi:MAG TPA: YceI family protein [Candidatus Binataceae bacterium]|nr:YceI family protein [Candidatus Binataceae bacterium]